MTGWVSPVPRSVPQSGMTVLRPSHAVHLAAAFICELAWQGEGVRVFRWPCGTLVVVEVPTAADKVLRAECSDRWIGTYARHRRFGKGPRLMDVVSDLQWSRALTDRRGAA